MPWILPCRRLSNQSHLFWPFSPEPVRTHNTCISNRIESSATGQVTDKKKNKTILLVIIIHYFTLYSHNTIACVIFSHNNNFPAVYYQRLKSTLVLISIWHVPPLFSMLLWFCKKLTFTDPDTVHCCRVCSITIGFYFLFFTIPRTCHALAHELFTRSLHVFRPEATCNDDSTCFTRLVC